MFESVVVCVDLEQQGIAPRLFAAARANLAQGTGVLHVVAVIQGFQSALVSSYFPKDFESKLMSSARQKLSALIDAQDLGDITPHAHVAHGAIYEEILHVAEHVNADLIVMAAHGPGRGAYLLGPHAARVARHAKQSVMVVRG